MIRTAIVFFAISCMSATSASLSTEFEIAANTTNGNGNFIIQLDKNLCINNFVPEFIDHAYQVAAQATGKNLVKRANKVVLHGTEEEHVHVFDTYNIGNDYKAIGVKFKDTNVMKTLLEKLGDQVVGIAADQDIKFNLPTIKSRASKKRLARRAQAERKGNLNIESLGKGCAKVDNTISVIKGTDDSNSTALISQPGAEWNLVRISQRTPVDYNSFYVYPASGGSTAFVYIVDDGLRTDHVDFGGRASFGFNAYSDNDLFGTGHGTHVAGIVGSSTYGVAKNVTLIGVKVLDSTGSGQISGILSGLQWVSNNAANQKGKAIVNMSLGVPVENPNDPVYDSFNRAVSSLVDSGIPVIAAAGNENITTCNFLPAANPSTFAVGATTKDDEMASFSNFGNCTDINAPGQAIESTFSYNSTATEILSGTSMAAPHVAGVAALFVDILGNPTPAALYDVISNSSTKDAIKSIKIGTPNLLVYN
ncbi:peptidase S8/S53 domain-containing protein, partial [Choanephora cucurbitarum]